MKIFNKVLAMVLALFTVLAMLPIGVLAETWADVDVKTEGNSSKVTLTLDAGTLADILQKDGISSSLLADLKDGVSVDVDELKAAFSLEELFEIVPRDEWLNVFDVEEILHELGSEELLGYIDSVSGLLNDVMSDAEKAAKLETLLKNTKGIEDCIDALVLIQSGYLTSKDPSVSQEELILNRISEANRTALINLIRKDPVKFEQLISDLETKLANFDLEGLRKLLDVDGILEDEVISIGSVVDTNKVQGLINDKKVNLSDIVDTAKVQTLINNGLIQYTDIVDTAKVQTLIDKGLIQYTDIVDTAKVQTLIDKGLIQYTDIVDTAKVQTLIDKGLIQYTDIVDTAKVQTLIDKGLIQYTDIVDTAKVQTLVKNGSINASAVVKIDVAATELGKLVATSTTLADEIASCVYKDKVVTYLENNSTVLTDLIDKGYVTVDGTEITVADMAGVVKALSVETLVQQQLVNESALAEIAVKTLTSVDAYIDTEKASEEVEALIAAKKITIDDVINTQKAADKVNALITEKKITIDDVINTQKAADKVNALITEKKITIDDVINAQKAADKVNALITEKKITIDDVINTQKAANKVNALIAEKKIAIDDVINTQKAADKVNALITEKKITIDDVINTQKATDKVKELIDKDTIEIDDIINTEKVKEMVEKGTITIESVIDIEAAKKALLALDNDKLMDYVNPIEAFRLIGLDKAVALVGGYEVAKNYIDISGLISDIDLVATIKKIPTDQLESVVKMNLLFGKVDIYQLVEIIGVDLIFAHIDDNEIIELARHAHLQDKLVPLLRMVFDHVLVNVDGLAINGYQVATEDADGYLVIDAEQLLSAFKDVLPSLEDIATMEDGKVLSFTVDLDYAVDGTAPNTVRKSKSVTFELVLAGDLTRLQEVAAELQVLIDTYINKLEVSADAIVLDVNIPGVFTEIYAEVLDYDQLDDDLKQKIMSVTNMSGDEMIAFVENELTYGELLEMLGAIEPSKLYDKAINIGYVHTVLTKVDKKLGTTYSDMSLDDLLHIAVKSDTSIEGICDQLSNILGRDIISLVDSLAIKTDNFVDRAEKRSALKAIFDAVESKMNIDLSQVSLEEVLDRAESVDLVEAVIEKVSEKVGYDIHSVLMEHGADELYNLALEKAAEYEQKFYKIINYIEAKLALLPDELMNRTLAEAYQGNGVIYETASVTYSPKSIIQKVVNRVLERVDISAAETAFNVIMDRVSAGTLTTEVDVTLRFKNLYRITYRSRDDINNEGEPLFTALVPVGTDLNIFKEEPELTTGYEFTGWSTIDGEVLTEMPAADTTVYADFHSVKLTFKDESGNIIGNVMVPKGVALNADEEGKYLALIADVENALTKPAATKLYGSSSPVWTWANGKLDMERGIGLDASFESDTTLVVSWRPNYYLFFKDKTIDYTVEEMDGAYKLTIFGDMPASFELDLHNAGLLKDAATDESITLTVAIDGDVDFDFLVFSNKNLASLYTEGVTEVLFIYKQLGASVPESFKNSIYDGIDGVEFYAFDITADGAKKDFDKTAPIEITVPFASAKTNKVTNVYTMGANGREYMNTTPAEGFVTFEAVHFSDFVIADEYKLDASFVDEEGIVINGTMAGFAWGEAVYFPAGAVIDLKFDGIDSYVIMDVALNGASLKDADNKLPETFTMPAGDAKLDVTLQGATYYIYYIYNDNGTMKVAYTYQYRLSEIDRNTFTLPAIPTDNAITMAMIEAVAPKGYSKAEGSVSWSAINNNDLGTADIYVFAQWTPINYTVKFVGEDGKQIGDLLTDVTIEKYPTQNDLPLPALLEGMSKWVIKTVGTPDSENVVTITLTAEYTDVKYPIVADKDVIIGDNKTEASVGEEITVSVPAENLVHYTVEFVVTKPNGETVLVTDGKFTMPASAVTVTAVYTAKTYNYTINGVAGTGTYGDTITFTVTVENGYKLKSISDFCTLVSTTVKGNTKELAYSFYLDGEKTVTYTLEEVGFSIFNIFNGKLFTGSGDPTSENENVKFNGWSEALFGSLRFATFSLINSAASLLWLWILLIVLLLIAIIALLYVLHITGKWKKPIFLVRFVVWIVNLFFGLCLLIAALGLKIAHLFGKSDEPADYGFTEVEKEEELPAEEIAEEVTEESVTEETTEAVEETTEATDGTDVGEDIATAAIIADEVVAEETVAEEATAEETVEETATEEVAEEATAEEVVEETATEEVVEEATAEETVEEPATEEVAEEATAEEVVEETATEEVVEEATAEETVEEPATEEVAEEATAEEVVEEPATEEVAEEATAEEAVEETATEEVAEEATAEEVVEETATEEVAEEATAEEAVEETATEEVAEEAAAEEVVEETATEEASDEENKNNK